jgi:hypothetical protein
MMMMMMTKKKQWEKKKMTMMITMTSHQSVDQYQLVVAVDPTKTLMKLNKLKIGEDSLEE